MDSNKYDYFSTNNKVYMVIIAILIVIIFIFGKLLIGVLASALYGILVIYNTKRSKLKKHEWRRFIEEFTSKLDVATKNTLVKLPFPLIIIDEKGKILWYNQNTSLVLDGDNILSENINSIIKEFITKQILFEKKSFYPSVKIKEKYYNLHTSIVDTADVKNTNDKLILIYFYDVTDMVGLTRSLDENKETIMLVEIDNLDEVVKSTEDDRKPLVAAEIERTINSYC